MRKLETGLYISFICLLFSAPVSGAAEYYTWVDENGVTNYSERSPAGYSARYVTEETRFGYNNRAFEQLPDQTPEPEGSEDDTNVSTNGPQMSDEEVEKQIAGEKARINEQIAAAKQSNCRIGRRNLAQLESYSRIRVKDDEGNERILSDEEKNSRIQKARQTIRENCS